MPDGHGRRVVYAAGWRRLADLACRTPRSRLLQGWLVATTADVLHEVLETLETLGADPRIAGGWGIDALVGAQCREHRDLDLAIRADALDISLAALKSKGYKVTTGWLPVRIELSDAISHVDLHPLHYEDDGSAWQAAPDNARFVYPAECWVVGRIGGRDVICLSAEQQRIFHAGYELSDVARHDMALIERHKRCR
jgi:lincosamide nucleotidyltransferase A/C/D/E